MKIVVFDPAYETQNAGDQIISAAAQKIPGLGLNDVERVTTHRLLNSKERKLVSDADMVILSGTNALSSRMEKFGQWLIDPDLALRMRNKLLLLGVGWWQYQQPPNAYTRVLLRQLLTNKMTHSCRDQYTSDRISALGVNNLMTGCPTMWDLAPDCQAPLGRNSRAVITVTDYKQSTPDVDQRWIAVVKEKYAEVDLVGMGPGDESYFNRLGISGVTWRGLGTDVLDISLPGADFVGTRLHAGVRSLQIGQPSLILAVDNRAREISRTTGLNVVDRSDTLGTYRAIHGETAPRELTMDRAAIDRWLREFERIRTA